MGLGTVTGLQYWTAAALDGSGSASYLFVKNYYSSQKKIDLTDDQMNQIVGTQSMLYMIAETLDGQVSTDPSLYLHDDEANQAQWGSCLVLMDNLLLNHDIPAVYSVKEIDEMIPYAPEFGAYVLNPDKGAGSLNQTFNRSMSSDYLLQDTSSYLSFLNTENMRYFYDQYTMGQYNALLDRFKFNNTAQVDMFKNYLDELIE